MEDVMYDDYDEEYDEYDENFLSEEEVGAILAAYRMQQLRQNLTGPLISFVTHVIGLILLCLLVVPQPQQVVNAVEVTIEEIVIKEIPEKIIDEIDEVTEEEVTEEAPEMEVPEVPTEAESDSAIEDASDDAPESDDNMEMEDVLDVVPHNTPLKIAGLYGGRSKAGKAAAKRKYGATNAGQKSVLNALRWLAKVQRDNGSWEDNPAHSGLALLCFLAHGETPLSEEFGITVQKAMQWLSSGMPEGRPFATDGHQYGHAIATYALAESYGMTQIPFLQTSMEYGLDTIIKGQQAGGGFDYNYKKGPRWDLSYAGWNYQALKAGLVAGSANEDLPRTIEKGITFIKRTTYKNGKFGYSSPGSGKNMTGVGTLCLQLLGEKRAAETQGGLETIMDERYKLWLDVAQDWEKIAHPLYGFYYDTQAVFHQQGADWDRWNRTFQKVLVDGQHREGYWTTREASHGLGGPSLQGKILSTTLCLLQLQVYYRYLPTFKMPKENIVNRGGGIGDASEDDLIIE
jgi:hypothetical protein